MAATALLFDLDGTIWDSFPCYGAALCAALGSTPDDVIKRLHEGENAVRLAREARLSNARFVYLCRRAITELNVYPNVLETLNQLSERAVPLGIVTNLPKWLTGPLLSDTRIGRYFDTIEWAAGKPSAKGLLRALATVGVNADEGVFYVGDLPSDAQAARAAGVSFAWAAYGYGEELPEASAVSLDGFSGIVSLL